MQKFASVLGKMDYGFTGQDKKKMDSGNVDVPRMLDLWKGDALLPVRIISIVSRENLNHNGYLSGGSKGSVSSKLQILCS